ncbi:hypothetical protein Tco_1441784 [Tanacetum coccineum]
MELCTTLQKKVLDLEKTKTTQANKIAIGLSARVESSGDEESLGEDASKQMRINAIDADDDITLVRQNENVVEEVVDDAQVSTAARTVTISTKEITLAQALEALKTSKPKVKGIVFQEPAKFDEEERLVREKAEKEKEANIALIKEWDDIQAKIDVDYQLAKRLTYLVEDSSKRAGKELEQESTKKQKVDEDKDKIKLQSLMKVILDEEEVGIDVVLLATKPPTIVD